jgi:hydroxymethylpyrimidine pyrophosphatase-like HAD family hydrolase
LKGLIALDIDGTITGVKKRVPSSVADYLHSLHKDGWEISLITGRSYQFAIKSFNFSFPFILATQNGANIFQMPEGRSLADHYLVKSILPVLDQIYEKIPEGYLVYSDYTKGDICYYKRSDFSKEGLTYLELLKALTPFPWKEFSSIDSLELTSFPIIKCFGSKQDMLKIQENLKNEPVSTFVIKDPIDPSYYLCLINHHEADKGKTVRWIQRLTKVHEPIIVAGNDMNDLPLLQEGTISISFFDSPPELLIHADIIVEQNEGEGIIEGIQKALNLC